MSALIHDTHMTAPKICMTAQGKWHVTIGTPVGEKAGILDLIVNGATLTGSLSHGEHAASISDGKITGNQLSWSAKITQPMRMTVKFTATVTDDRIEGTAKYLLGSAAFRGHRA